MHSFIIYQGIGMASSIVCGFFLADRRNYDSSCDIVQYIRDSLLPFPIRDENHENLAIMVINHAINIGADHLAIASKFEQQGIVLCIVVNEAFPIEIWNFYRDLVHATGGEYMLFRDAPSILANALFSAVGGEDTLRQAFFHSRMPNPQMPVNNGDNIEEQNQEINDIGDLDFDHGLSQ
ncbi:unnamed protein product [Rotaria socialis]